MRTILLITLVSVFLMVNVVSASDTLTSDWDPLFVSKTLTELLMEGDEEGALSLMDENMRAALSGSLSTLWTEIEALGGTFEGFGEHRRSTVAGYEVVELTLLFTRMNMIQTTSFNDERQVAGLFVKPGEVVLTEVPLPDGVREEDIVVDAGDGYRLDGRLTLPQNPLAAVVLVHGSGPVDMDSTVGANKPFRDLAYGLAERGVAVLRYDKRTYSHAEEIVASPQFERFTVDQETVRDARKALEILKEKPEFRDIPLLLVGHSMGGMLASYIGSEGVAPDGYVILASTPRTLWQISAAQNLAIADELEAEGDLAEAARIRSFVETETKRAKQLSSLSDEEALVPESAVFGLGDNAWYLRHMESIDAVTLHLADEKPLLIVHADKDRQVTSTDFELWQERLSDHHAVTFKHYPELNHLLGAYEGDPVPLTELVNVEYATPTPVSTDLLAGIVEWIRAIPWS